MVSWTIPFFERKVVKGLSFTLYAFLLLQLVVVNSGAYPVTSIYRFEKSGYGRNIGDVYFGTTNGIYLSTAQNNWINPSKINNGVNNAVAEIKNANDNYNSVFVRTNNGEAYYLNGRGELSKYTVPFPVTSIYRFEKGGYGRENIGDVYFGTTDGVYLAKMGSWTADTKINGVNEWSSCNNSTLYWW